MSVLPARAHGAAPAKPFAGFDLDDVLARALREAWPAARRRALRCVFDAWLPASRVMGDATGLQHVLQRLLRGAIGLVDGGRLLLDAHGTLLSRRVRCSVAIAGSGRVADGAAIAWTLRRLGLSPEPADAGTRLHRASGRCPRTGAMLAFSALAGQGFVLRFERTFALDDAAEPVPHVDVPHGSAWVIDTDTFAAQVTARRLQQLGWQTSLLHSAAQARRRLHAMSSAHGHPALVVGTQSADVTFDEMQHCAALLAAHGRCVLAMPSDALSADPVAASRVERCALPLSTVDLVRLTAAAFGTRDHRATLAWAARRA